MKDMETINRFILHRSQGWNFNRISTELGVAKQTLINWSRKYQYQINNLRATELEALQHDLISTRESRARTLADHLKKVEAELASRSLEDIPTARLYTLAASLRDQVIRETGQIQFTSPVKEIPDEEYTDQVHDWNP